MANRFGLTIRAAAAADTDGLEALLLASGLDSALFGLAKRLEAIPAEGGAVLLATEWGPPSGVVCVHWNWTLISDTKIAFVTTLLVDPQQRRRGIARLLLKAASQAARSTGCGELRLASPIAASALSEFCLATGFAGVGDTFARSLRKRA